MKKNPYSKRSSDHEGLTLSADKKNRTIQKEGQYSQILIYDIRSLLKASEFNKFE
jgi:hypothetical protein